jgi:hypothetical protein
MPYAVSYTPFAVGLLILFLNVAPQVKKGTASYSALDKGKVKS